MQKWFTFLLIILVIFRYFSEKPKFKSGDFIRITAEVTTEPIQYSTSQYLKLMGLSFYLPKYPEIVYGDKVVIEGKVEGNKLLKPKLLKVEKNKRGITKLRSKLISFYKFNLPEPHASLVAGTVLGSKQMPQSFWNTLKKTGTAHVVVASGTNVTLLAGFLIGVLTRFLKRRVAIVLTIMGIVVYVFLSGFDAPIVRAGIMGSVAFMAQEKGRLVDSWRLLLYSASIMLLIKPAWITDLGFILSFVATVSLMLFQKRIDGKLKFVPNILREGLSTSLAAQIGVAPIIFVTFGQFNILSPVINALVLWVIPYIMIIGGMSAVIYLIIPKLGEIILYPVYPLTLWFITVVNMF